MEKQADSKFDPFLTVQEVCQYLKISDESLYGWIKKKNIPAHRVGKRWLFDKKELDAWVRSGKAAEEENHV